MRGVMGRVIGLLCIGAQLCSVAASDSDESPKIPGLNVEQQKSLAEFIRQNERPNEDLKILADRSRIRVRGSKILQELFPHYRFVIVPWVYRVDPKNQDKYSIPGDGAVADLVALSDTGADRFVLNSSGNREAFANFLREQRVKVSAKTISRIWAAYTDIYIYAGGGSGPKWLGKSEWRWGYQESPFRAISSDEEIREVYYIALHK